MKFPGGERRLEVGPVAARSDGKRATQRHHRRDRLSQRQFGDEDIVQQVGSADRTDARVVLGLGVQAPLPLR